MVEPHLDSINQSGLKTHQLDHHKHRFHAVECAPDDQCQTAAAAYVASPSYADLIRSSGSGYVPHHPSPRPRRVPVTRINCFHGVSSWRWRSAYREQSLEQSLEGSLEQSLGTPRVCLLPPSPSTSLAGANAFSSSTSHPYSGHPDSRPSRETKPLRFLMDDVRYLTLHALSLIGYVFLIISNKKNERAGEVEAEQGRSGQSRDMYIRNPLALYALPEFFELSWYWRVVRGRKNCAGPEGEQPCLRPWRTEVPQRQCAYCYLSRAAVLNGSTAPTINVRVNKDSRTVKHPYRWDSRPGHDLIRLRFTIQGLENETSMST
jgi:hypothetical protein